MPATIKRLPLQPNLALLFFAHCSTAWASSTARERLHAASV
jgi:hypothetical protein